MSELRMDLGLKLNGRAKQPVTAVLGGELTHADLEYLQTTERGTQAPPIAKLRERHHALARALASGIDQGEAGILCGYSPSRVSILMGDHSFKTLVLFYKDRVEEKYLDMHERMAGLGHDAVIELADRLEETPDEFSIGALMELAAKMADRTGHGVTTKSEVNIKVGLADRLASARKRTEEYIDITPEPKALAGD